MQNRPSPFNCVFFSFTVLIFISSLLWPITWAHGSESSDEGCYALAMPQYDMQGVILSDTVLAPTEVVKIPACKYVTLAPRLQVQSDDRGKTATILMYIAISGTQQGYLFQQQARALNTTQTFDFFHTSLDFSGLSGLEVVIYFGYLVDGEKVVYNAYDLKVVDSISSDYTPPSGAIQSDSSSDNGEDAPPMGPGIMRLRIATSDDGLNFEKTDRILTDQADVADLVVDQYGWIYAYFVGGKMGDEFNKIGVAISFDGGEHWVYKFVNISGAPEIPPPVDPDVVILEDGTFRLYVTQDPNDVGTPQTYYAEGGDGINFTLKGKAFGPEGIPVYDPTVIKLGDTWHLYAWDLHGTSSDGKSFQPSTPSRLETSDGQGAIIANMILVEGGCRAYGYSPMNSEKIYSFFSTDGASWRQDSGNRLTLEDDGIESGIIKEPAVAKLKDGTYLMLYSTMIP